jgi:hypothetical protein
MMMMRRSEGEEGAGKNLHGGAMIKNPDNIM